MTIEDRLKYIKSEYGEDAEKMWRQVAQLPNFKEEFLTDDKLFMCITQRGFMSQNGNLGLNDSSFYKVFFKGIKEGKIIYDVNEKNVSAWGKSRKQSFDISIDEQGRLVFEEHIEEFNPKDGIPRTRKHELETIGINNEGNIEYTGESEERQFTSETSTRIIKGKEASQYDRKTGIKTMQYSLTSEQRNKDGKVSYFEASSRTSKLNDDFATVTSTIGIAKLIDGEVKREQYSEVSLYDGEYIPMDDFSYHGFLERPGKLVTPETPESVIEQHRIKLAEGGLKHVGKLPIEIIEQLPDDIKRNIQGYKENINKPEVSTLVYGQIYQAIMEHKEGPGQMREMTEKIMRETMPTKDNQREGQDLND